MQMKPIITSALIGAGSNLLGGLLGQSSASKDRALYRKQLAQAQSQFDAQMDESIQRRVKDAMAAGIHPLFALGASSGASPTISAQGAPETGNAMGNAVARMGEILGLIPMNKAAAEKDEAEAMYYRALAAKTTQDLSSRGRDAFGVPQTEGARTYPLPDREPVGEPMYVSPMIAKTKPGDMSTETGVRPPYVEYRRRDGSIGTAFGAEVPGAEEINALWIPLQNWWHTSKVARQRLRDRLGINNSLMSRLQSDPEYAAAFVKRNKRRLEKLKKELNSFNRAISGAPIR
jgi:hypothetical protein